MTANQPRRRALVKSRLVGPFALALVLWGGCSLVMPSGLFAQESPAPATPLELDLLEGVEEPPAPEAAEEAPAAPSSIEEIASQMERVENRLREADPGATTQQMQHQIIDGLAAFIEQLRESQSQGGSSRQSPLTPPADSERSDPPEPETPPEDDDSDEEGEESIERHGHEPGDELAAASREDLLRQAWGHLPGRVRQQMPNAANERFLPLYQRQLEEYYRSLTEAQPSDSL